jgi:hypothetical protein
MVSRVIKILLYQPVTGLSIIVVFSGIATCWVDTSQNTGKSTGSGFAVVAGQDCVTPDFSLLRG